MSCEEEYLHASDAGGVHIKSGPRRLLLAEMRDYSRLHGDAPWAVPVVQVMLLTRSGALRLVQRGDKEENPHLWDKSAGGHVVWPDPLLPRAAFDANLAKEMAEELGIEEVIIATDPLDYDQKSRSQAVDLSRSALVRMVDYQPWSPSLRLSRDGGWWRKRQRAAVYIGLFDGEFRFVDGEAEAQQDVRPELLADIMDRQADRFTHELPGMLAKYGHFMHVEPRAKRRITG